MRRLPLLALAVVALLALSAPLQGGPGPVLLPPVVLQGLQAHVEVLTDPYGVPHIYAQNLHDLYFVTGYIQARDRLFQMDVARRQASGTLAELLGREALKSDVTLRTLGLRRAAELSKAALSQEALAELQAFADGVNAYIAEAEAQGKLPPEYAALEITKVEPWTVVDSLVIGKAIAFQLSFDLDVENTLRLRAYQQAFGDKAIPLYQEDLYRSAPANPAAAIPDATGKAARHGPALASKLMLGPGAYLASLGPALDLAKEYYNRVKDLDFFQPILHRREMGSNWFLIAGQNTVSGYPIIANDPHLSLTNPAIFYEIHQVVPGELNVYGVTFAGIPLVIQGQNERIAWGSTTNPMDVTDTFKEKIVQQDGQLYTYFRGKLEPVQVIPEVFKVNVIGDGQPDNLVQVHEGVPQATLVVPRHGPIINLDLEDGTALSVQFTGFYATRELETFRIWNRAKDLDDFIEGLQYFDFGSQNWAYADVEGNIAYFTSAELPLREDLEAGTVDGGIPPWLIRDGTGTYKHEWIPEPNPPAGQATPYKILPFNEMPQIVNPPLGFVVNANNDPVGNTLDNNPLNQLRPGGGIFYLNYTYDFGFRAGRLTELIREALASGDGKVSLEEAKRFQGDVMQLEGRRFVPYILAAYEAAKAADAPPELAQLAQDPRLQEAIAYLRDWSFNTPTGLPQGFDYNDTATSFATPTGKEIKDSIATTIFNVWASRFVRRTIDATLEAVSPQLPKPGTQFAVKALLNLLDNFDRDQGIGESGLNFFPPAAEGLTPAQNRDLIILESLKEALDLLAGDPFAAAFNRSTNLEDYRWGRLHRVTFKHVLGGPFNIPPAAGFANYPNGIPTDGALGVVDASNYALRASDANGFTFSGGPARRMVAEVTPQGPRAWEVIPGGASGVPGRKHFGDQLRLWLANDYHPVYMRAQEVKSHAESYQDFYPRG